MTAEVFDLNWAARINLIYEKAPAGSAFSHATIENKSFLSAKQSDPRHCICRSLCT